MRAISTVLIGFGGYRPHGGLLQRAPTAGPNSGLLQLWRIYRVRVQQSV